MSSLFEGMRKSLVDFATMVTEVVKCDLEVVDADYNRLIGTGIFSGTNAPIMGDGVVYKEAAVNEKYVVIQSPRKHAACNRCINRNRCLVAMEIAFPIMYKNECVALVGIVCANFQQKTHVMNDIGSHLNFLRAATSLLSRDIGHRESAVFAGQYLDVFRDAFAAGEKCAIIVSTDNTVADFNDNAKVMFNHRLAQGQPIEFLDKDGLYIVTAGGFDVCFDEFSESGISHGLKLWSFGILDGKNKANEIRKLEDLEMREILKAVQVCGDTTQGKKLAADKLGIGVATLYRRLSGANANKSRSNG